MALINHHGTRVVNSVIMVRQPCQFHLLAKSYNLHALFYCFTGCIPAMYTATSSLSSHSDPSEISVDSGSCACLRFSNTSLFKDCDVWALSQQVMSFFNKEFHSKVFSEDNTSRKLTKKCPPFICPMSISRKSSFEWVSLKSCS